MMGSLSMPGAALLCLLAAAPFLEMISARQIGYCDFILCRNPHSRCFGKLIFCPRECPHASPPIPSAKKCYLNCNSPTCESKCLLGGGRCERLGSGCQDPRFIGGDGVVFYFHGRKGQHFALVSDDKFQVNARFTGLRPPGRDRDFTWIQALGIMVGRHALTVDAMHASRWDDDVDHLSFSFDGEAFVVPEGHRSRWKSADGGFVVERMGRTNRVVVVVDGLVEVSVDVVPVTEEDSRVHHYQIPKDDCFAHLDVQFRFGRLSKNVDGVLGRTYREDYQSPEKILGVAMPILKGGENRYRTTSLLSADCNFCVFKQEMVEESGLSTHHKKLVDQ